MIKFDDLALIAPGGASGSFVSVIFGYYLGTLSRLDNIINLETGDCHRSGARRILSHFPEQIKKIKQTKTVICIRPTKSHVQLIAKMMYYKHFKSWIKDNPELAVAQWPELNGYLDATPEKIFERFMSNIDSKIHIEEWLSVDQSCVDLLIEFDDVLGSGQKNLNEIISNFLKTSKSSKVDEFIDQYRLINQKYF